jgi:hypothetical protein
MRETARERERERERGKTERRKEKERSDIHPLSERPVSWSTVLLEKPVIAQLVKYATSFGTRWLVTVFTKPLHWTLF